MFKRPFLRGLFLEGLIFEGAYVRREICVSKCIGLSCSGKEIYHFCFLLLCIRGQIPSTSPPGKFYLKARFNGAFFALQFWGAHIWRGLYMDGLIFGILRYYSERFLFSRGQKISKDLLSYIVGQIIVSNLIKCVKNEGINNARLHETRKKT